KEMKPVAGVPMSKEPTGPLKRWETVALTTPAPEGAKYIRVILISSNGRNYIASSYFDNVTVTTSVPASDRTAIDVWVDPQPNAAEGDDVSFVASATAGSTIV